MILGEPACQFGMQVELLPSFNLPSLLSVQVPAFLRVYITSIVGYPGVFESEPGSSDYMTQYYGARYAYANITDRHLLVSGLAKVNQFVAAAGVQQDTEASVSVSQPFRYQEHPCLLNQLPTHDAAMRTVTSCMQNWIAACRLLAGPKFAISAAHLL